MLLVAGLGLTWFAVPLAFPSLTFSWPNSAAVTSCDQHSYLCSPLKLHFRGSWGCFVARLGKLEALFFATIARQAIHRFCLTPVQKGYCKRTVEVRLLHIASVPRSALARWLWIPAANLQPCWLVEPTRSEAKK
jgi:hypothetical protein